MLPLKHLLLFLLCLVYSAQTITAQPITVSDKSTSYFGKDNWFCFTTQDSALHIGQILSDRKKYPFTPVGTVVLNGGIPDKIYWFHFILFNPGSENDQYVIEIQSPRINQLELFEVSDSGLTTSLGKLGDFSLFEERKIIDKDFVFKIALAKGKIKDYYLRVNQIGHTFILPIVVQSEKQYGDSARSKSLIDGFSYGILLFVVILSFYFFINHTVSFRSLIRNRNESSSLLFLYYCLYIFTGLFWFLSYFELGFQFFWPRHPNLNTVSAPFFASLNILLNVQISQVICKIDKTKKSLFFLGNLSKILLMLSAIFPLVVNLNNYGYFINHLYLSIFLSCILFGNCVVFVTAIKGALSKREVSPRFYFIASFYKVASIFNLALLELGITPGMYHLEGFLQIGITIEVILLTFAVSRIYTNYKLVRTQAMIEAEGRESDRLRSEIHNKVTSSISTIRLFFRGEYNPESNNPSTPEVSKKVFDLILKTLNALSTDVTYIQNSLPNINEPLASITARYIKDINDIQANNPQTDDSKRIQINFSAEPEKKKTPNAIKIYIYTIIKELINNISKHAKATRADINISFTKKELLLTVKDNGVGIDPEKLKTNPGIGLNSIRSRIDIMSGSFLIKPLNKDAGTCIIIKIPLASRFKETQTNQNDPI